MMEFRLDNDQRRAVDWRIRGTRIATLIGPPGGGKTTTTALLAILWVVEKIYDKVLLVAYTNSAANEFCWELYRLLGESAKDLCLRTGYPGGVDASLPIPFSRRAEDIRQKKIIVSTNLSLKKLPRNVTFDNMIVDEAGIERLEHLLWPLYYGINPMVRYLAPEDIAGRVNGLIDLLNECGVNATIVGDPKQSKPISPVSDDYSAITWASKRTPTDTLFTTHRLPDQLAGLVNEFADYGGLKSAEDIAGRRLTLTEPPNGGFVNIIDPENVVTWADLDGEEGFFYSGSWLNDLEARACVRLCRELRRVTRGKSIVVITRFRGQRDLINQYLRESGIFDVLVQTTTSALGTQADIVIFSLARNNDERNVGAAGTLEDLNVAISRAKEKLIILGNFEMMANGWSAAPTIQTRGRRSPARKLANLIESRYGRIVDGSVVFL